MRTVLLGLALCAACRAHPTPDVEIVVPPSAAHPQNWLSPRIRLNPKPGDPGKTAASFAEFVAPEVLSKIVVDQYAGPSDDVHRYLVALPNAAAKYFGPSLAFCKSLGVSPGLTWTSTSTVTFESGRSGRLAVATVNPVRIAAFPPAPAPAPDCVGTDKIPYDSLYVSYVDPDGYTWFFAIPLQRKK